jgi:hypothetical protein
MQVVIDSGTSTNTNTALTPVGGASTFGSGVSSTNITNLAPSYTLDTLTADLKRGAAEVITGVTNGTTVMKLEPAGQYVVFQHKDAVVLGTTGAYSGTVRTGLGITSTGILGGYNRTSDGVWQTTFAIESSTGNLTLLGTIRAASVISASAYLGSTLVSDVVNNAASVTNKLNKNAADILSGTIEFSSAGGFKTGTISVDSSGNATGAGVAFTSKGIVGRNISNTTFTIDATTGAATFAGALVAASGSFVGTVSAGAIITDSVTLNSAGGTSLSIIASQASGALPSASFSSTLQSNLNSGVTNILAGTGSNYRLKVDASLAFIAFQHKDAVYNGTSAAGLGILPAVGISSAGIAMGYNDNTGAWNNSVAISAAGNLTVKGTISAGSIIVGSVTIGAGGTTLTAVEGNASSALSLATSADANATSALSQVTNKLNKNAADILSGGITFSSAGGFKTGTISIDGSGNATGDGVAFTSKGIVGRTSASTTFTIDATTGAATFKGDITGATGNFAGNVTAGNILSSGATLGTTSGTNFWMRGSDGAAYFGGETTVKGRFTVSGSFNQSGFGDIGAAITTNAGGASLYVSNSSSGTGVYSNNTGTGSAGNFYSTTTGTFGLPTIYAINYGTGLGLRADSVGNAAQFSSSGGGYAIIAYSALSPCVFFQGDLGLGYSNNRGAVWTLLAPSTSVAAAAASYLNSDGTWKAISAFATTALGTDAYAANRLNGSAGSNVMRFVQGTVSGAATAGFSGTNKPGSASSNTWMQITIDATTLYIPVWT